MQSSELSHISVMLEQAVSGLAIRPDGCYVDATYGRGGHSQRILSQLGPHGRLIALDRDPAAVQHAHTTLLHDARACFVQACMSDLSYVIEQYHDGKPVDGVLMDIGVSSPQLDEAARGFSFMQDGPLDMRMNPEQGESAAQWLNHVDEVALAQVFKDYGEERYAKRIAHAIVLARADNALVSTGQLAEIVAAAHPRWEKHKHPATRVFQAIRIFINQELDELSKTLAASLDHLAIGGRLVVIAFHSLEDRLVKQFMRGHSLGAQMPLDLPIVGEATGRRLRLIGKAQTADEHEVCRNVRARSAVLRIAEKLS